MIREAHTCGNSHTNALTSLLKHCIKCCRLGSLFKWHPYCPPPAPLCGWRDVPDISWGRDTNDHKCWSLRGSEVIVCRVLSIHPTWGSHRNDISSEWGTHWRLKGWPHQGFPGGSEGKESYCNAGDLGSIPGLGRSPGGRHDNLLQYSCLENPVGQRSLAGYSPWGGKESDMIEHSTAQS